ncbi:glycoside hydrolase family 15 protein [Candidatus Margulisiibacteriota bacterium]
MKNLDYGVIGNCRSAAMISKEGAIEWCCLPDFTSPSIFAKILDRKKGGEFGIIPEGKYRIEQFYKERTNILVTHFISSRNEFQIIDFMPRYKTENHYHTPPDIIRYFKLIRGKPKFRVQYNPKLLYAEHETKSVIFENTIKSSTTKGAYESIYLYSNLGIEKIFNNELITLATDGYCLLSYNQKILDLTMQRIYLEFRLTQVYWLDWVERSNCYVKYTAEIIRSSLVLKLLTYQKTGAILAAVTTSLPETIGEVRNWDYRFCWMRDASMIISCMTKLGHINSAERFLHYIIDLIPYKDEKIQIMYGIRGEKQLTEYQLDWLQGYENSTPVRVGNDAYHQKQNDIYGVLVDIIYKYFYQFQHDLEHGEDLWTIVRSVMNTVIKNWHSTDRSIWEYRSQKKHFVFSKVLCWVALDRGVKLAMFLKKKKILEEWAKIREEIKADIMEHGWNGEIGAFTQAYGSDDLDAANLLIADYGFIDYHHPKYVSTVIKIKDKLMHKGLMFRYKNADDFGEPKSSFIVCTFWLIKSLFKIGQKKEATRLFEKMLSYSNHLGLLSEDLDFNTKRLLGNFPQGYSHLALIDVAITLSEDTLNKKDSLLDFIEKKH